MSIHQFEQAITIRGESHTPMLGVLHSPHRHAVPSGIGVVIVNGGAQYRAGAHRLFVQLARQMAKQGHAVLRFDFPGQGDSPGDSVGFEETAPHIGSAINALHRHCPALEQTALLGLCDGASACLLYLHGNTDPRISKLILLNPWVHDVTTEAQVHIKHYYRQRLLMPDFWLKLFKGGVGWAALWEMLQKWIRSRKRPAQEGPENFQSRMGHAWQSFDGSILLILSEDDQTAQEFRSLEQVSGSWASWKTRRNLHQVELIKADHTFSPESTQMKLFRHIGETLQP